MSVKDDLTELLSTIGANVYATPVDTNDVIVCLSRLQPMTADDRNLAMAERRALMFIKDALTLSTQANNWDVRFSRPWVLKGDQLAYTWDFTLKGDLNAALTALRGIKVMASPVVREEEVAVQRVKPKRGHIRPVSVGAIR